MPARRFELVGATLLVCAGLFGGCGSRSTSDDVRNVVQRFGVASAAHDYQEMCDHLIDSVLTHKLEDIGLPCELALKKGLQDVRKPTLTIGAVRVIGSSAYVAIHTTAANQPPSDDTLKLTRTGAGWRISALSSQAPAHVPVESPAPAKPPAAAGSVRPPGIPPGAFPTS